VRTGISQQIDEVNVKRKREQESVAQELSRQEHRMKTALWTSLQVSDACRQMEDYLKSVGVPVPAEEEEEGGGAGDGDNEVESTMEIDDADAGK
jgi:Breast carcinoma amplified sequence 2 (BCAS2)